MGAQVAPPIFLRRFHEMPSIARKRDLPFLGSSSDLSQQTQHRFPNAPGGWNPKSWVWDSAAFMANPSKVSETEQTQTRFKGPASPEEENLTLKLGGRSTLTEEPSSGSNKRVRSGSPGNNVNYPACQVDNCKADLSNSKDYHRRHKVCEVHSKTTKAMVSGQMQRFCQQCSRYIGVFLAFGCKILSKIVLFIWF